MNGVSSAIDILTIIGELARAKAAVEKALLPDGTVPQSAWKEQQYLESMARTHRDEVIAAMDDPSSDPR